MSLAPLGRVSTLVVQQSSHTPPKHTLHTCKPHHMREGRAYVSRYHNCG